MKNYVPKKDTQLEEFLLKYPEYDGRGVVIAIIDNGLDVSLPGMQQTTTGLPKIIDCFDFTGNGNVDTSIIKEFEGGDRTLIGLNGQKLKIPEKWKNPSGQWHLGCKNLFEICFGKNEENEENEKIKLEMFKNESCAKNTVLECIVWFDGEKWQAYCSISLGSDNLENSKILTSFRDEQQFDFLLEDVAFCVTIHENGNLLEVNICSHDHAVAVAHAAAAYFPDEPEKNGVAPGAQIVSMNVMNSAYFEIWLEKAFLKCIEMKVNIISFSIGHEFDGKFESLINEMIEKHGIIFVISAGNYGPSYASLQNCKQYYDEKMFVIGAALTAEISDFLKPPIKYAIKKTKRKNFLNDLIKREFYNVKQNIEEEDETPTLCLFSSRGPMNNGSKGITFIAPGVVMACLPKWRLRKNRRASGTSFSGPFVAGSIACLISALKANSMKYSSAEIRMALADTAVLPKNVDRIGFGYGLIQINSAFEYFKDVTNNNKHLSKIQLLINFESKSGIYLIKEDWGSVKEYLAKIKIPRDNPLELKLEANGDAETWIQIPKTTTNNSFHFKIDTKPLKNGSINYAEIHGFDSCNPSSSSIKPLFSFPITVICPEEISPQTKFKIQKEILLKSRIPNRFFFISLFNLCKIKITSLEENSTEICVTHSTRLERQYLTFTSKGQSQFCAFKVREDNFCEIDICYSNLTNGETSPDTFKVNVEISSVLSFKGQSIAAKIRDGEDAVIPDNFEEEQKVSKSFLFV